MVQLSRKVIFLIICWGCCSALFAQVPGQSIDQIIEKLVETQLEDEEINVQPEEIFDHFYSLSQQPVSINSGTTEDLKSLRILNDFQIHSLIKYREDNGLFKSVYELQLVYGFDASLVKDILPFITLKDEETKTHLGDNLHHVRHEMVSRYQTVIEKQEGYKQTKDEPAKYTGDASRQYYRYGVKAGKQLTAGFTLEKDPGEKLFPDKLHQGLDYNSGYFQYKGDGFISQLNIGDYHANWGQGLVLWTGFGMGKSSYVTQTERIPLGLSKYSSSNENRFMRGASVKLDYKNWNLSLLFSSKNLDATLSDDSLNHGISSFYETGLHATALSREKKDKVKEMLSGIRIDFKTSNLRVGLTGVHHEFALPVFPSDKFYKLYDFAGTNYQNLGFDYHYNFGRIVIYGEQAVTGTGDGAFLNAMLIKVHPKVMMNVLHRKYSKRYHAHYGNAFSESSKNKNEQGLYMGLELFPFPTLKVAGYADAYRFPFATFKSSRPSHGNDYFLQAEYLPTDKINFTFRWKTETKQQDYPNETLKTDVLAPHTLSKYRFDFEYDFSSQVEINNRIELSGYKAEDEKEHGMLFYQDVKFRPKQLPVDLYLRYYLFNTKSYNSRIYSYENDVLYTFTIPGIFDSGVRYYAMMKIQASRKLSFWIRYSRTTYSDRTTVSSGDNEIQDNHKSDIKLQMRLKL